MPVFQKNNKKILYIHIPKAGGTTIEHYFIKNKWDMSYCDIGNNQYSINKFMKTSPQHMDAKMIESIFDLNKFDFIFMITRNPLERIKSEYKWRKQYAGVKKNMNDWILSTLKNYSDNHYLLDNHIKPQNEFEVNNIKIFKLEDGLEPLTKLLENTFENYFLDKNIETKMRSKNTDSNIETLSNEVVQVIQSFYLKDFQRYNYQLSNKSKEDI